MQIPEKLCDGHTSLYLVTYNTVSTTAPAQRLQLFGLSRDICLDVLLEGPISRADLARRHDLTPGTVTRLTAPLLRSGLLAETDEPETGSPGRLGRPSKPLTFVADNHHFIGLKLTGEAITGVLVDTSATVLRTDEQELAGRDVAGVTAAIAQLVNRLRDSQLRGVGIGLGGNVQADGVVQRAPFLGWQSVPLADLVSRELGDLPTILSNDVQGLTETEHWFGTGHGLDSFAVITLGAGVGYGLVCHERLVTSPDYGVGLIGHLPLDSIGPRCPRGHIGCAAAMLTDSSIAATVSAGLGRAVSFDESLDLALDGNPLAAEVVAASGRALGRLIALVANLAMPQRVIVTGEAVRLATIAAREVADGIRLNREPLADEIDYVVEPVSENDWARGAAVIAIQHFMLG